MRDLDGWKNSDANLLTDEIKLESEISTDEKNTEPEFLRRLKNVDSELDCEPSFFIVLLLKLLKQFYHKNK